MVIFYAHTCIFTYICIYVSIYVYIYIYIYKIVIVYEHCKHSVNHKMTLNEISESESYMGPVVQ